MRLAYISDQRFYRDAQGNWYTTASFPLDKLCSFFPNGQEWMILGRLDEVSTDNSLYRIPMPLQVQVTFAGVWGMKPGPLGYLSRLPAYVREIRRVMKKADVAWMKTPFIASLLAWQFRRKGQITLTHMVGDAIVPLAGRYGRHWAPVGRVVAWLLRGMYRSADLCAFVSRDLRDRYASADRGALVVNESRVSNTMIRSPECASRPVHGQVLYVGRLSGEKGLDTLVKACALIGKDRPLELVLVGDGPERQRLEQLGRDLDLRIRFCGQVPWGDRLWELYGSADLFVLPSLSEGLPLVLVEAMSQGVPIVASRVGGIPELVDDKQSGLLVAPGDVAGFARAISSLLTDAALRERLITTGLVVARANTVEAQISRLATAVNLAAKGRLDSAL